MRRRWPAWPSSTRRPAPTRSAGSAQIVVDGGVTIALPLGGASTSTPKSAPVEGRRGRRKDRDSLAARLGNPAFAERAKPEAVEKARADHDARAAEAERLGAALARLG